MQALYVMLVGKYPFADNGGQWGGEVGVRGQGGGGHALGGRGGEGGTERRGEKVGGRQVKRGDAGSRHTLVA
jgi:hypothetical protein